MPKPKSNGANSWVGLQVQCDSKQCKAIYVLKAGDDVRLSLLDWTKRMHFFKCKACGHRIEFGVA